MAYVQSVETSEVDALRAVWGDAPQRTAVLEVEHPFLTGEHQMLASNGRRAEVCYVMHRGDPTTGLLLHTKQFYPNSAYRLPTGGIHQGELVIDTLAREITEETGLVVGYRPEHVQVQRFLGLLAYEMHHRQAGRTFTFATYHFLVQMPADADLNPQDPEEQIAGWQWCLPPDLHGVADILENVRGSYPFWGDWGQFRSLSHRFVATALEN